MRMFCRLAAGLFATAALTGAGCKFPYPEDVPDDDAPGLHAMGGTVTGLWTGGAVTLRLVAGDVSVDLAANGEAPFVFGPKVLDGTSYLVTVVDDGPDHDCTVANGNGRVMGADVTDLAVECTNNIGHSVAISTAVPFTFDPRVTRYTLPVSVLQQELTVTVDGAALTGVKVAGQAVTIGRPSQLVALGQGQTTVMVELTKGPLSRRYELVFDRGATPVVEALYGRANNADAGDRFGTSIAASGDYVAIGADSESSPSEAMSHLNTVSTSGAVYIYKRSGGTWVHHQLLKGSFVTAGRRFGASVAMDGDLLVVGAADDSQADTNAGAAYVFRRDPVQDRWVEEQRIVAPDPHATDRFGTAVAIAADRLAIGAPGHDHGAGSNTSFGQAYIFKRSNMSWSLETTIRSPTPLAQDRLGALMSMDDDEVALAAGPSVAVYRRSGTSWIREPLPATAMLITDDGFGNQFAIEGDTLAVGAVHPSTAGAGAIRIFTYSGGAWTQDVLVTAPSAQVSDNLGLGVALRSNVLASPMPARGLVQIFKKVGGSWVAEPALIASGPVNDVTNFGRSLAMSKVGAVLGAFRDNGPAAPVGDSGTSWFFR